MTPLSSRIGPGNGTSPIVLGGFVIVALYVGRGLLIPFALALLLSFLLFPVVNFLERYLGRIVAVLLVVFMLLCTFIGMVWIVSSQLYNLANKLPEYRGNIQKKIQMLVPEQGGALSKLSASLEMIRDGMNERAGPVMPEEEQPAPLPLETKAKSSFVIPVRVVESGYASLDFLRNWFGPLLEPFGAFALVLLYIVFMLIRREGLRDRFTWLIGQDQIGATTQGLDDAAVRIRHFLMMKLAVNAMFGICVAIGLFFIGVPNFLLWGLMVVALRFIPFVGFWIALLMPLALSFAISDTWVAPLSTLGLYAGLNLLIGNAIEPWLFASKTGVSPLALVMTSIFWAWLWGPIGLLLATPLTVCLIVLGRYAPRLEFLSVLFSDESALTPASRIYQRLLALDQEEATETIELYRKQHSLIQLYDDVLLPVLVMAQQDFQSGVVAEAKQNSILQSFAEMIDELGDEPLAGPAILGPSPQVLSLLCLPTKGRVDEIAGVMLEQVAQKAGLGVFNATIQNLASEMMQLVETQKASVVCISVIQHSISPARYLCKKLRQRFPDLKIIVGLWGAKELLPKTRERLLLAGATGVVSTMSEALIKVR